MENSAETADLRGMESDSDRANGVPDADLVRGSRVLVVASDSKDRWAHVGVLREHGASVAEARDGAEALDLARQSRPDLVVAEANLPSLGGPELRTELRRDVELGELPVVILGDTQPPTGNSLTRGRSLADAVVALLEAQHVGALDSADGWDPMSDRENIRAQSTVAMYRQPANHVPRSSHPVWRLRAPTGELGARTVTGFDSELRVMSRILGAGFVALVAATLGLIGWQIAATPSGESPASPKDELANVPSETSTPAAADTNEAPAVSGRLDGYFTGELRPGVDESLTVGLGQGVLELSGPASVTAFVDGIDRGPLPLMLVLDEGRHVVRYTHEGKRAVRFYYVKSGATRSLDVITRPGGFVDAR